MTILYRLLYGSFGAHCNWGTESIGAQGFEAQPFELSTNGAQAYYDLGAPNKRSTNHIEHTGFLLNLLLRSNLAPDLLCPKIPGAPDSCAPNAVRLVPASLLDPPIKYITLCTLRQRQPYFIHCFGRDWHRNTFGSLCSSTPFPFWPTV